MITREALYGYSPGGAVLTLVLPLGLFIVVMIGMSFVFRRVRTMPGHQPVPDPAGPPAADAARVDIPGNSDDTAVSDTLAGDTAGGASAADSGTADAAHGDTLSGDTLSGDTAVGGTATTGTPQDPQ